MTDLESIAAWLLRNHPDDGLTHAEVCEVTGVPAATLQNWANRRLIRPLRGRGKGERRVYGSHELSRIVIARYLQGIGLGLASSFDIASKAWMSFCEGLKAQVKGTEVERAHRIEAYLLNRELVVSFAPLHDTEIKVVDKTKLGPMDTALGPVLRFAFGQAVIALAQRAIRYNWGGLVEPVAGPHGASHAAMDSARGTRKRRH